MKPRTKSQNGRRSVIMGKAFERYTVNELQRIGLPAERNLAQTRSAAREGCDVEGSDYWIECKVGADPDPRAAYAQARRDRGDSDSRPIVVVWKKHWQEPMATLGLWDACACSPHRRAEGGPLVTMLFADWLALVTP